MDIEKPQPAPGGDGCLVGIVRVPVKIVAVLVVLPVRVVWDLLVAGARAVHRHALRPLGDALGWLLLRLHRYLLRPLALVLFYWPWVGLWRYLLVPVATALHRYLLRPAALGIAWTFLAFGRYVLAPLGAGAGWIARQVLVPPVAWVYRRLLTPLGHGLRWLLPRAFAAVFVWPWTALWRYAVVPVGRGLLWLGAGLWRYVLAPPLALLHRYVLAPLGQLLVGAWHLAGRISRALGRGLRWLWRGLVARPAAWVYRQVATPVGHVLRTSWRTARAAVREARAEVRRVLFGGPPREPARSRARTLGSTTAVGNAPAPEISLHERQG
ncbi:hypothetical protein OOK31_30575 [Streptomyces sp. NBC_00249]|uniref:hypothetical protein n=1 Tax=Streptomyces sp. NBC_00249 TaxID=2975690 RepID=UPI00224EFE60|nr:hypothetical protein [Streptomyces sp. NBC_00249]MCX5198186.1 hypothetical protein [Streptomyces sp. NBC_00249]